MLMPPVVKPVVGMIDKTLGQSTVKNFRVDDDPAQSNSGAQLKRTWC
jgi:hypothetical protein